MSSPLKPVPTYPLGGQIISVVITNTFTWQSDGSQAAYYLEYCENTLDSTILNTGWVIDSLSQYIFPVNSFINTKNYKWRIKIRNNLNQESLFSDWSVFLGGSLLTLTIIYPQNDLDTILTLPIYQHSFTPVDNSVQYSFRYRVYTSASWDTIDSLTGAEQESMTWDNLELYGSTLVWDSGVVVSTSTSVEQPSGYLIPGVYYYKIRCTVVDNQGNSYDSDLRTYYILLNSIPQTPIIIATNDNANGRNTITITNPTPDPGQVTASYNKLYRKKLDSTWELLVDNITTSTTYDTTCRSSKQEEYSVTSIGTNGIESGKSTSAYATCELESYWFTNTTTNTTLELTAEVNWGMMQSERKREEYQPMDEIYPFICYSSQRFYRGSFQAVVLKPTDGTTWSNYIATIRTVLDTDSSVIMRTPWGDLYEFDIYDLKISPYERTDQARIINFNLVEIDKIVPEGIFTYDAPSSQLDGYWVLDPNTNRGIRLWIEQEWDGMTSECDRYEGIGLTSEMPSINYGNKKSMRGGFSGCLIADTGELLYETVIKLRSLIDAKNKNNLIFQTMSGDRIMVDIYGFSFEMVERTNQVRKVSFEFIEIGVI